MKVLHVSPHQIPTPGIVAQLEGEASAARSAGLPWDTCLVGLDRSDVGGELRTVWAPRPDSLGRSMHWGRKNHHRRFLYGWLEGVADHYDVILLRHTYGDPWRARAIARLPRPVISVHHTLEVPELRLGGIVGSVKAAVEALEGPRSLRSTAGIVGVTHEIVDYELSRTRGTLPTFVYPNGVDIQRISEAPERRGSVPELLFLASRFDPWQGLDRLLDSIRSSANDFVLHLVGTVNDSDARVARSDSRVVVHGRLPHHEVARLAFSCWLGLSALAMDRKGMREACALKTREYLAWGLPVYADHRDVFPEDFPFFRRGAADVEQVLDAAHRWRDTTRSEVRQAAVRHIDKASIMRRLYEELLDVFGNANG